MYKCGLFKENFISKFFKSSLAKWNKIKCKMLFTENYLERGIENISTGQVNFLKFD